MDAPPLILEHLTTADGLPQGTVMTTQQDSQGFIWLGTEDGLVRYDGHELVRYAYSRDSSTGLPGNFIYQTVEDVHHDLWIAIKDGGVARWNRATDAFTVYRHIAADPKSLASDSVRTLAVDRQGQIWVGTTDAGIDVLNPASGSIRHLRHRSDDSTSLGDDRIFTLTLDRVGSMWVGTENGLDLWDHAAGKFTHYRHSSSDRASLSGNQVSRIVEDAIGNLWIGTFDGGLDRMDRRGRVSATLRHDAHDPTSLASDDIRAILEDRAGHLWVGTADGLDLVDPQTLRIHHYRQDPSDPESLKDSYVMSLYEDATGLIWIGMRSGGVSRWNPRSWELGAHRPQWIGGKLVTAFADGGPNKVWVSSLGGGLVLLDTDSGAAQNIDSLLEKVNALGDSRVMALRRDRDGNLWIGTMSHGLFELTPNGVLSKIPVQVGDAHSISAPGIMAIFQSHNGAIWIGTHGGGANFLDPATHLVHQLPHDELRTGAISFANVSAFAEDSRGNIWIGTDGGGLDLARPDGSVVRSYRHDAKDSHSLPANTVYSLEVDAKDRVWIGTDGGGLARVVGDTAHPDSIEFDVMTRKEGLTSDTVYGVVADSAGQIWLSGNAGLLRYNPDTHAIKTYHRQHGLQGEEFDSGAYHRLADGRICFGGPGGFNIIDPVRITENNNPPRLALTGLAVMGLPVATPRPSWLLQQLNLDFRANIITLDFGVLDFSSVKRNHAAYRMAGLTDRWIDVGVQQRITLTNLEAGDHLLEVRAANADSVWSAQPLQLKIHRDPAPWRSPWAYATYIAAILALIAYRLFLQREKFRRVVREQQRLESEVALRTRELSESNSQLAEAVQAKGRFMDRMSHELRTPMNGVLGMTELLVRTNLTSNQARITQTIQSSGRVLLQIVNDLLDLSKINAGKVTLEEVPIDLLRIVEECASLFTGSADSKGVELFVCPPLEIRVDLVGDPLRLRQILMNLVGNAVKFTSRGEIVIRANVERGGPPYDTLRLSVSDTGIGMDAQTLAKIFTPFTQADESTTRRFGGTGLGLAICRELIELMGGKIGVDSKPQVGSTFHVEIPVKLGESPAAGPSLPCQGLVHITTRHRALEECLNRHSTALGLVTDPADSRAEVARTLNEIHFVDADCVQQYQQETLDGTLDREVRLVILATEAQVRSGAFGPISRKHTILLKPINQRSFLEAIFTAAGQGPPAAAPDVILSTTTSNIGGHILLVEDESVNAAVAQGYLSELGCTCVWVREGAEAVARNSVETFDLILMDLSMPGLDGFATAALLREQQRSGHEVPIVALTAHGSNDYRDSVLQAGMVDMLSKPCTLEQCEAVLRKWIRTPERPVAPSTSSAAWSAIDAVAVARLRKLRGGAHPDLYHKLIELFQSSAPGLLDELKAALEATDLKTAAGLCHKFASSAANVGASSFAQGIRELEQLCKQNDLPRGRELYSRLRTAYPLLIEELQCQPKPASAR